MHFHNATQLRPRFATLTALTRQSGVKGVAFEADGLPFRRVTTDPRYQHGLVERFFDEFERALVSDPVRTALDALRHPSLSGGLRGVMDAWEFAADDVQDFEERGNAYLDAFSILPLRRRAAAMAAHLGLERLATSCREACAQSRPQGFEDPLDLIAGTPKRGMDPDVLVVVPW